MAIKMPSPEEQEKVSAEFEARAAIDRYHQFIEAGEASDAIYYNLGVHYMTLKDWKNARVSFEKALEMNPELVQALVNLGGVCFRLQEFEKSLEVNKKAVEIKPDFIHARSNYAMTLLTLGNYEECIKQLEIVLETEPKHPIALAGLSRAYSMLGDEKNMNDYKARAIEAGVKFE